MMLVVGGYWAMDCIYSYTYTHGVRSISRGGGGDDQSATGDERARKVRDTHTQTVAHWTRMRADGFRWTSEGR